MEKVLFLGRFSPPMHGAARMNDLYYDVLKKKYDVEKIKINYYSSLEEMGRFSFVKLFGVLAVFFKLFYRLVIFKPKLVLFEIAPRGFAFYRDSVYAFVCKLFKRKIIFAIHSREVDRKRFKFVVGKSKVILLSESLYEEMSNVFSRENVYFLGNGILDEIDDGKFKVIMKQRALNKKPIFVFLSNMIESKGTLETLELCSKLKKAKIDFKCFFVGAFPNGDLRSEWFSKLEELGLEGKCEYLGVKYGNEKIEILASANWLVFPTDYPTESYPLVILEAFMLGVPVVSYDTGAIKDIVVKDYLGFVSKKKSVDELFGYLKKNIERKNWSRVREYFKRNYTIEIAGEKLLDIVDGELK
ncbi:MAG: glycosyltransferase family 4 protein [Nanoarchaeota archaeon]|nr:glycosyltransferase family 4 protein [Nanoarchaeota archaeon]